EGNVVYRLHRTKVLRQVFHSHYVRHRLENRDRLRSPASPFARKLVENSQVYWHQGPTQQPATDCRCTKTFFPESVDIKRAFNYITPSSPQGREVGSSAGS